MSNYRLLRGALLHLIDIVEGDHYKCDMDSDEECDLLEHGSWQVAYHHGAIRRARQLTNEPLGENDDDV